MSVIKRLLAANRSEIAIRVFRSTHELGIRTVAIYSHEDRFSLHRFKADEAYEIGRPGEPLKSYLNYENIITLAADQRIDAIHPGYGFLSENADFARACDEAGIIFVGPRSELLTQLGDKVSARKIAQQAGVPVLGGSGRAIRDVAEGQRTANKLGYPVILKASHGGGGRGMRVVQAADDFAGAFEAAQRESQTAFGPYGCCRPTHVGPRPEITPRLVRRVKQWQELFRKLHEEHSDLIAVDFDDCTPDFFHLDETAWRNLVLTEEFELQSFIRSATLLVPHSQWAARFLQLLGRGRSVWPALDRASQGRSDAN